MNMRKKLEMVIVTGMHKNSAACQHSQSGQDLSKFVFKFLGLSWTGYMSLLTGQDWTPKFAEQVLLDQTKSGFIFLNILHIK